jgi:hypothetical protein
MDLSPPLTSRATKTPQPKMSTEQPPAKKKAKREVKRDEYRTSLNELNKESSSAALPQKKFYRQRAHANPFSDHSLT